MDCTINDINLSFDKENRLRKTILRVSNADTKKAVILAGLLTNTDFRKFLLENITESDALKGETISFNLFTNADYIKLNQNRLGYFLNEFYKDTYLSVDNTRTVKGMGKLDGFTSASAKQIAKRHTASTIIDEYMKELRKPPKSRRTPLEIIAAVNDKFYDVFNSRMNDFVRYLVNKEDVSAEARQMAQQYIDYVNKLNEINKLNKFDNDTIRANNDLLNDYDKQFNKYTKQAKAAKKAKDKKTFLEALKHRQEIKDAVAKISESNTKAEEAIAERNKTGALISRQKYALAHNIVARFADNYEDKQGIKLRNYANLVMQTRANPDSWYFQVFNTKYMTSVVKEFNKIEDIESYIEQLDENNDIIDDKYNEHNIDETTKTWEDSFYKNFNETIAGKLRMVLSTLSNLSDKYNPNSAVQALDTDNELGVSTYMDAQYLTVQIFSFGDFSSVRALIETLDKKSQTVKSLYGLGQLVAMMKAHKDFANYVYVNFAKPLVEKTILTISDISNENGIKFDYSNRSAFPLTELVFRMANKLRATYNTNYDVSDVKSISDAHIDFLKDKNKKTFANKLFIVVNKYFPNFGREVFDSYFDNIPNDKLEESTRHLIGDLADIINGIGHLKKEINRRAKALDNKYKEEKEEYNRKLANYNRLSDKERLNATEPQPPTREYIDYSDFDLTKQTWSGIIGFAERILEYSDSHARLNTANAAGNTSADVIKNCFISRFFDQIKAESEEDSNAGLKNLLAYVTQGTEDGSENQYSNNPILFGLKDENGVVKKGCEGLFIKTAAGYEINPNAKNIIKFNLFDGTKNTQDSNGETYATMSKIDFFLTQYMAFADSVSEMTRSGQTKDIGTTRSAVYATRIASDAPKNFFIRAPRYNRNQVQHAFYNHLMDEFNLFIKGINAMFVQEGNTVVNGQTVPIFKTRTDVNNLIGRAFFDEKVADRLKQSGKTDMTSAIVKDGRLQGNLFKFLRLFKVNGYDAGAAIERVLSLYGDAGSGSLMSLDEDGRLRLNPNNVIFYNPDTQKFELNLSTEIKKQLKDIVRNWTNNFLIEAKSRSAGLVQVFKDNNIPFNETTLEDFFLNSANMNMNYDDLFEGDFKYYSSARDFLKRTKESQAGGEVYAGYDILEAFDPTIRELSWYGKPEEITIDSKQLDENGNPVREAVVINGKPLIAKNGFRGVTIYNTVKTSDYVDVLQKDLERIFIESGMDKAKAHERSVKIARGYGFAGGATTKINDAQSYITLEEFIRRKWADGTISEYADLIRQLLDDTPIENLNLDEINARIQVQKNFYYDKVYDPYTGVFYARQIKNAEFVLIPKLIAGTELAKVHDWMQANGIGQLNTAEASKAAKKNVFTIWDAETGEFNENFAEDYNDSMAEDYFYEYLYKQQDTPQHMEDETNKAGVQITKMVINNILNEEDMELPDDENGNEHPRKTRRKELMKLADEYHDAYTANIKEDFHRFCDAMGWVYNEETGEVENAEYATTDIEGNPLPKEVIETNRTSLNFTNFWTRAREEAARLGLDSNFMEYFTPDEFGNPIMPNFMNVGANKFESVMQAIYNRMITRQEFPGWHAAQITSVGYSRKLEFDPTTGVMQVLLPRWSKLIPKPKNAEEEAALLKQMEEEGIDIHIGYRMPTEGGQSIGILKVVGFVNDALGSTIVVPDEWVTQTGSDFDIDSVYGISWEMYAKRDKKGRITLHKIPYEESAVDEKALYMKYVRNTLDVRIKRTEIGQEIETNLAELRDRLNPTNARNELQKAYEELDAGRNEAYEMLPGQAQWIIKDVDRTAKRKAKEGRRVVDIRESFPEMIKRLTDYVATDESLTQDEILAVTDYVEYLMAILDVMQQQEGLPGFDKSAYRSGKAQIILDAIENAKAKQFAEYEKAAGEAGLMSYDEWSKLPFVEKLDRRARNNYIMDRMVKILSNDNSREAQYSRSNFEGITNEDGTGGNDVVDKLYGETTRERSPYNPLDQLDYFEDAMGGARLKAFSVNWDTFAAKNNRIRAKLSREDSVEVIVSLEPVNDSEIVYDEDTVRDAYGEDVEEYDRMEYTDESVENRTVEGVGDKVKSYTLHTGSQIDGSITKGGDSIWVSVAKERGITKINAHGPADIEGSYKAKDKTAHEIEDAYQKAAKALGRPILFSTTVVGKLVRRSYLQVKDADAVFAIGPILSPGERNSAGYINRSEIECVDGGTGYAVQMAIDMGKPVHVYDYVRKGWFVYNPRTRRFTSEPRPQLTPNFTGIGSRQVEGNQEVIDEVRKVFDVTENGVKPEVSGDLSFNRSKGKRLLLTARNLGHSRNNRNIIGELVTIYGSQTTSHHLDAVKMGSVPNVNEFTFNVYKFLSSIGLDFETVISFIRQPILMKLVANNNLINSIFVSSKNIPIRMTMADIAIGLGLKTGKYNITHDTGTSKIIDALRSDASFVNEFKALFGINIMYMQNEDILKLKFPIDKERLFTRIRREVQKKGNPVTNAAFDFGILLTFKNLQRTSKNLNSFVIATTPDKYGAKTSIHETRNVVETIFDLLSDKTLSKNGKPFMEFVFPHGKNGNILIENSEYKPLAAVYQYATKLSVRTNSQLFITENDDFYLTERIINERIRHRFTEKEYQEYRRYAITYLYNLVEKLLTPVTVDERGRIIPYVAEDGETGVEDSYWNAERSRICGYGVNTDGNFDIKNVNKPSKQEIEKFVKLTPAQKVLFIQRHFPDGQGISNYANVTLMNNTDAKYRGVSRQYINIDDQVYDVEELLYLFTNSFANRNPLVRLTAIDLIKYAFIAEGFNYKSSYISKIVPNDTLYSSIEDGGLDIIGELKSRVQQLPFDMRSSEFIDRYVRSHSEIVPVSRLRPLPEKKYDPEALGEVYSWYNESTQFLASTRSDKLVHIDATMNNVLVQNLVENLNLFNLAGGYIRIAFPVDETHTDTVLYKVEGRNEVVDSNDKIIAYQDYFLVPLNLLDKYETYEHSYNKYYNRFNSKEYYDYTVQQLAEKMNNARGELAEKLSARNPDSISAEEVKRENSKIRGEVNREVTPEINPVGAYQGSETNLVKNENGLMELYERGDEATKGGVQRLVDGILAHIKDTEDNFTTPYVQFNPNFRLKNLIPKGAKVTQNIEMTDGSTIKVTISHPYITDKFATQLEKMMLGQMDSGIYAEVIKGLIATKTLPKRAEIYRVTKTVEDSNTAKSNALKAATDLITDDDGIVRTPQTRSHRNKIDIVSSAIINEISYDARKNGTSPAKAFIHELERHHVNRNMGSSLVENRGNIYKAAARYYQTAANEILNKLDAFSMLDKDGNPAIYSMDDVEMYEALAANDEFFGEVANLILRGITFGNRILDLFKVDLSAEDVETQGAIKSLINSINSVRQNKKLTDAMNNIINIYFKKYSTNPEIIRGVLNLQESFGDLSAIDAWLADPTDIDNNEVQVILKQVFSMFSKAEMFETKKNVEEWRRLSAEIDAMAGTMDIHNVIDSQRGMIRQDYNSQFVEDKQAVIDKLNEAYINRNNSYEDFERYIRAKYERDKFMYENTEQHIIGDYYKRDLKLREDVMRVAGSVYIKYMQLAHQLREIKPGIDESDESVSNRKRRIISAMQQLRSEVDINGMLKSREEQIKARALNEFIEEDRKLKEEFFESKEYDGFQETYKRYKRYIDAYDAVHKYDTLEQKFADDVQYKEAYNWIKSNGRLAFGKEESLKLRAAFKKLTGRTSVIRSGTLASIRQIDGAVDESGIINPLKLTDEQIEQIREEELSDLSRLFDTMYGEGILIKDVPRNVPLMRARPNTSADENIFSELKYKDNAKKVAYITEINMIIGKCIDKDTGELDVAALFNNDIVSDAERAQLASLYGKLRDLRSERSRRYKRRNNSVYEDATNNTAFLKAMNYYNRNLKNTKQGRQFLAIFTEIDHTGNVVPNSYIYGYKIPKADYIDSERTDARNFIEENVDFVTTEYYEIAEKQAREQGEEAYRKWFRLNHIYDPYTHRFVPLKIWTKLEAKPNSKLAKSMQYIPTFDNTERTVKKEYINNEENRKRLGLKGKGYQEFSENYKKGNPKYDTNVVLNEKERAYRELLTKTLNKYATTYQGKRFVAQGYLPRERKIEPNARWAAGQLGSFFGIDWRSPSDSDGFYQQVDYSHDREGRMEMLGFLVGKGTQKYKPLPVKGNMTNEEYAREVARVREENRKIKANNEKIDNAMLNRNWNEVMENFIHNATIFNSRQAAKPYLYLLLEDLAVNNAYMLKGVWGKHLVKDRASSTDDDTTYATVPQTRTRELVHNLARRLLYNQYHENNTYRAVANFLQNLTSAKYMVFNLYGGISNIATGKVNMRAEALANEYFGYAQFSRGQRKYLSNSVGMIRSIYSENAPNLTVALIKKFKVLDFDQVLQYGDGGVDLVESLRRAREWLYTFQSAGEHFMHNSVLLAMLASNRLYTDKNGVRRIGDFKDYTWDLEQQAMEETLQGNDELLTMYRAYVESMKDNTELKYKISTNQKDLNRNFLHSLRDNMNTATRELYRRTAEAYHKKRRELLKDAKVKFEQNTTIEDIFEFKNGQAVIKADVLAKFNAAGKNPIGDLEHLLGGFRQKVIRVNNKIHGVYDKSGAAMLESKWFGSLIMQYHKHLYNGIFKRWRKKGFYSEFRGSRERGSYITFWDYMGTEFTNFKQRRLGLEESGENVVLASLQVAMQSTYNTLANLAFNYQNLADWERANMRRILGDLGGILTAALVVLVLYGLYDDDDIKDDTFKSSLLYLADRLYSESSMYSPMGLISEYKTIWSSPIAAANGPGDFFKAAELITQALFDPDFNPKYKTGQYAGKNKFTVLLRRNIPGIRPWDRIQLITKNNKYYKIGSNRMGTKIAKSFGESLRE